MKRRVLALLLAVLLLLTGCVPTTGRKEDTLHLFYEVSSQNAGGEDIIKSVAVDWADYKGKPIEEQVREVLDRLLQGDRQKGLLSPMPAGTVLQDCGFRGSAMWVDFSGAYGQLSGMELTIADYCVTLSLTQLPGVYAVSITVNGQDLAYRDRQRFAAAEALLTSSEDVMRNMTVRLYFPDAAGQLSPETRTLAMYEGESLVQHLLQALQEGPVQENLTPLLPEDFSVLGIWMEEETCCLNLAAEEVKGWSFATTDRVLRGLTASLCSVRNVRQVQILVDGQVQPTLGGVNISEPLFP